MLIGLTGGIASGKTTVSNILKDLGLKIINADKIAHELLKKGNKGYERVVNEFGEQILNEDEEINRDYLGKLVFNDEQKRNKLENLTHPLIIDQINEKIKENEDEEHLVIEAPLLYEVGLEDMMDQVWVVYVNRKTQIKRLKNRDDLDLKEAKQRIDAQIPLEEKKEKADIVIDNNGTKQELKEQVKKYWEQELN